MFETPFLKVLKPLHVSNSKKNIELNSLQDIVAYCARVSNPANQNNTATNEKLIRYLIKNAH